MQPPARAPTSAAPERSRRRARIAVAVLAVVALAIAVSCQQVLAIDGPVVVGGTVDACGLTLPAGDCEGCVASACCDQLTACAGDPSCKKLETCLLGCGSDYACRSSCVASNPVPTRTDVPLLDACVAGHCNVQCGMPCGQAGGYVAPDAAAGCEQCLENYSCQSILSCTSSPDCEVEAHCEYACPTPDCRAACVSDAGGGDGGTDTFTNTAFSAGLCYSACGFGRYWACVGRVSWPYATVADQDVTLTVYDPNPSNTSLAGVTATACGRDDPACAHAISSGTTGSDGKVTLALPAVPAPAWGFQSYFELSSPDIPPYLYFLAFPLSAEHAQLALPVASTGHFATLASTARVTPDPNLGHLAAVVEDCLQLNAPDVTVAVDGLDPSVRPYYFASGQPSTTATATDGSGLVVFFNVPPGQYTLHATPAAIGRASSTATVFVRAGTVSLVTALPTQG